MPGPVDLLRLVALAVFLALVAVGLWLLEAAWWVVILVMAGALLVAWTIEWLAWRAPRGAVVTSEVVGVLGPEAIPPPMETPVPPVEARPAPPDAIVPPQPRPEAQPEARAEPKPEPEPQPASEPVVTAPDGAEEAPPERRQRRMRLRPLPSPRPEPEPERAPPAVPAAPSSVVAFPQRTFQPQTWNLWDLERIARTETKDHPERRDEFAYLFLHLREFATADGSLPTEFDGLVRESFAGLLERTREP